MKTFFKVIPGNQSEVLHSLTATENFSTGQKVIFALSEYKLSNTVVILGTMRWVGGGNGAREWDTTTLIK